MAKISGNELVVRALKDEGVDTVFYLTGGPMVDVAAGCIKEFRAIDVRHEQAASMAAHAYSRVLARPGVCFAASGPAATNLVTGVGNAYLDAIPVVALGGASAVAQDGMGAFQEMNQVGIFKPITKFAEKVIDTARIPETINKAFRMAMAGQPGPVYVDLPGDVLYKKVEESDVLFPKRPHVLPRVSADPEMVRKAVAMLRTAKKPLVITGTGIHWSGAYKELKEFVELTGIPFYTTPQGRGVIEEDHELSFLGARNFAWKEADVVVFVGTRLNFIVGFGLPPRFAPDVKIIQVDISDEEIGRNRPVDVGIVGDAKTVLRQLIDEIGSKFPHNKEWVEALRSQDTRAQEKAVALLNSNNRPIHPLRLFKEVRDFMDRDAIVVVDGHETLNFARQSISTHVPGHRVNAGPNGCMGVAVPFGLGAKVAKPNTQVIVLSGDGSFGMNGMEIDTMVRHNIPVLTVISNNGGWAGIGGMDAGRDLGYSRYDKMAEVFGGYGEFVEKPEDIRGALDRAAASGKPAVVNVVTDPHARSSTVSFANYRAI